MKNIVLFLVFIFGFSHTKSVAQGCSDAGFCTIDVFKPEDALETAKTNNQFKVGLNFGQADNEITVFGQYLEYNHLFSDTFSLTGKLTSLSQSGNETAVFGLSDFYINGNLNVSDNITLTAGLKIPLTDGNTKDNDIPLPMDYQSSLGTFDLILGMGYKWNNLNFALAYQQPLTQNENEYFIPEMTIETDRTFFNSNKFNRTGDILLRVSYPIEVADSFKITPSLLPIYHLTEDSYKNLVGNEIFIEGSSGLTVNANAYFDYALNDTNALQLSIGIPLKVRDARPDGLTRKFVANLEYSIKF